MYILKGCYDPIQKITGDAYEKVFGMGKFYEGKEKEAFILWSDKEEEQVWELLEEGFRATGIAKIMRTRLSRVKSKIEYIRKKQHLAGEAVFERIDNSDNRKPVLQFTKGKEFVKEYDSTYSAFEQTNIDRTNICRVLRGHRHSAGGFVWRYK